jgi:glycosyltransferase involved in cell wall biosynthesis
MENPKILVNRRLQPMPFHMAQVEIIIPFSGEQNRVTRLIESIFKTVTTNRYLISLVDDGSKNASFIRQIDKAKMAGVRCFRQDKSRGFGSAVNVALKTPFKNGIDWVCVMRSNTLCENMNWLKNLGESYISLENQNVGMVSTLTNHPGYINVVNGKKEEKRNNVILKDDFLPLHCILTKREVLNSIGMFEDDLNDLDQAKNCAEKMSQKGFKQAVSGSSWVHYYET